MPQYMLLLYADESVDEVEAAERWAEMPVWDRVIDSLRASGTLVANGALQGSSAAKTVRVRADEMEVTDGPFAATKETLAGYFVIDCGDLDAALKVARMVPMARYGSVEVRPLMTRDQIPTDDRGSPDA